MTRRIPGCPARVPLLVALGLALAGPVCTAAQAPARLLVTVVDPGGAPVAGLGPADFTLRVGDAAREIQAVAPVMTTAQVVAIFEGLAATQRQTNAALTGFIANLDEESVVDMQSVEGNLDAAIVEAVEDLHARAATRPVIVMLGQESKMVPSELQSSQVRGKRQAADLSGDLERLEQLLSEHGILFYGVSVTEVSLTNLEAIAAATGGRFAVIPEPTALADTLSAIGRELGTQYVVTYASAPGDEATPRLDVTRPGHTVRIAPIAPTH